MNEDILKKVRDIFNISYVKSSDEEGKKSEDNTIDYGIDNIVDDSDTMSFQDHLIDINEKTKNFEKNVKILKKIEKKDDALYEGGEIAKVDKGKEDMTETKTNDEAAAIFGKLETIFGELDDSDINLPQDVSDKDDTELVVEKAKEKINKSLEEQQKLEEEKMKETEELVEKANQTAKEVIVDYDEQPVQTDYDKENKYHKVISKKITGKVLWVLDSPGGKWDKFYDQKQEVFDHLFFDSEEINYDYLMKELREASAKIKCVWNPQVAYEQMANVQNWRDRVGQIQVDCHKQYFILDRFLELLRGSINLAQYEKPSSKQEGLYYLHLRDFEHYHSQLKAVLRSAEIISKTLDGAFETLSRQITVMLPQRSAENAINRINKETLTVEESVHVSSNKSYDKFDTLSVCDKNKETDSDHKAKTGIVEWNDIGVVKRK